MSDLVIVPVDDASGFPDRPVRELPAGHARRRRAWLALTAIVDVAALIAAGLLSGLTSRGDAGASFDSGFIVLSLIGFAAVGLYTPRFRPARAVELGRIVAASAVAALLAAGAGMLAGAHGSVGDAAVVHWALSLVAVVGGRVAVSRARRTRFRRQVTTGRTLIVGAGRVGHLVAKRLADSRHIDLEPIGFLDKDPLTADDDVRLTEMPDLPVLGASSDLERVVREQRVEYVVVAFSTASHDILLSLVRQCWRLGVDVLVVPRLFEVEGQRMHVEHLGAVPLISLRAADPRGFQFAVKYALDRVFAGIALLALSPLFAGVALAIWATSGGPLLFRQRRVGRDGHVFEMFKFRTMDGAPGTSGEADATWAERVLAGDPAPQVDDSDDDDRRTPLGKILRKLSLDELPQLWNVLRGDMSLIGPRPERVHYVERFERAVYRYPDRHRVKSGLTGWAQVSGFRGETSLANRIEWDNFYIEHWTPWLDLKIVAMTFPLLFGRRGGR